MIAAIAQVVSLHARSCSLGNKQEKRRVIVNCRALAWQTWAACCGHTSLTLGQEKHVKRRLKAMEIGGRPHCWKILSLAAVLGLFSVACLLLGHKIAEMGKQPGAEKHLEAIFALRRARILRFCQKEKNLSHPPSPPNFLNHIDDLPGDIFVSILDEKYMVKLSR